MKKIFQPVRIITIFFAFLSIAFYVYIFFIFSKLKPKMIEFKTLTDIEETMMVWVGIGLLVTFIFFLLSLLQIIIYIKYASKIEPFSLFLIIIGIISLLAVFSDVALINDIHKQYRYGLAQPEWSLVYPMLGFQFVTTLVFTYLHFTGYFGHKQLDNVARDINIFLVVHYIGFICGIMGLAFASLGFFYPHSWTLLHTSMNIIILLFPYALAVFFWLITKLLEKDRQWFDEKQRQDLGKSALLTLIINSLFMILLFITNYQNLDVVIRLLWLPLHLFGTLFLFSLGNLYFSNKA